MLNNKKRNPLVTELFIRGRKNKYFPCFYYSLICCNKRYYTKFKTLFYYENSKQKRTSTNCI